MQNKR